VSKNGLFEPFMYKNEHFTKTGSGQTQGRLHTKKRFSPQVRLQLNAAAHSAKGTAPAEGERREPAELVVGLVGRVAIEVIGSIGLI
jgi:hypothetical protein